MEARELFDLFFIVVIAIVVARYLRRRQAADLRRRSRPLDEDPDETATGPPDASEAPGDRRDDA